MPRLNLGRVVGRDGGFGNVNAVYVDTGGEPNVTVTASGEDIAKDFEFRFENIINAALSGDEIDRVTNGEVLTSSSTLNGTGLTRLWAAIKNAFAAKIHVHNASGISDGCITKAKLATSLRDDIDTIDHSSSIAASSFMTVNSSFFSATTGSTIKARRVGALLFIHCELKAVNEIPAGNQVLGTVKSPYSAVQVSALCTFGGRDIRPYITGASVRANVMDAIPSGTTVYLAGVYLIA